MAPTIAAAGHDRHAAFGDARPERQHAQADAAARDRVLEHLGRPSEFGGGRRLRFGDADRRQLRIVETVQHHEVCAGIDNRDGDAPAVLRGLGFGRGHRRFAAASIVIGAP